MNKTQKGAWFTLVLTILFLAFFLIIFTQMFAPGATSTNLIRIWSFINLFFMAILVVWLRIKQSRAEVDSDERDELIKKRAVLVSFASVWILLIATTIIPWFAVGQDGSIPVCLLPIINFGVFLTVVLVHSMAVLIQYGWGGKDEKK